MNTIIRTSILIALLSAIGLSGKPTTMKVVGSTKLQLVIVDSSRATVARDAMHEAFAASLAKAMGEACGDKVEVEFKSQNADQAAFGLDSGNCHVVLSIGKALPRPLIRSEMERLNATLGSAKNEKQAYLVFLNSDAGLTKLLTKSFADAITDTRFLDALDGGIDPSVVPAKDKILAAAQ